MFAKLFSLYPAPGNNIESSMRAYMSETRTIPALVISHALHKLTSSPIMDRGQPIVRRFVPPIQEVRAECGRILRELSLKAQGKDPNQYSPELEYGINADRWISRADEVVAQYPALAPGRKALSDGR